MVIKEMLHADEKRRIARQILEALPEWFGIPEAREGYIESAAGQVFFAAMENDAPVGFLCLKETGKATAELSVMGVVKKYQRRGVGRGLLEAAKACAAKAGYRFLQVKTVQMGKYTEYDGTNRFYLRMGFQEFELFPTLWGEGNPCQIYVMAL